jgi:hypothetical protein
MVLGLLKKHAGFVFPLVLLFLLIIFTSLKISGSSVGFFNTILFNGPQKNTGLALGHPQVIRSDEWEVNTPLTVAQAKSGFPVVNRNIGNGQDMAIVSDVPYKAWSEFFKPQNWSFFVLPLEYAFAFKWWFIGVLLMLSSYVFCLQILPKKYLLSSLISVSLFLSPFIQWWYQSVTLLPVAYGILIAFVIMRMLDGSYRRNVLILWSLFLVYIFTCFAFVLYLPFVLSVAFVVAAFLVGHFLNLFNKKPDRKALIDKSVYIILSAIVALGITFIFLKEHSSAIKAIQNSVYPGHRVDPSGGFDLRQLSSGYYNIQLQYNGRAAKLPAPLNQSEFSNFILLFPFLIPVLIYLSLIKVKGKFAYDWRVVLLLCLFVIFLIRLFAPFSEFIFNLLQINRIPHDRLLIGLGLINVMLIVITIGKLYDLKTRLNPRIVWFSAGLAFAFTALAGFSIKSSYKGYIASSSKIILISLAVSAVVWLMLKKKFVLAMAIFALFSFVSVVKVNPLYRGLSPIVNSNLSNSLAQVGDEKGRWIVSDDVVFENVITANNLRTLSGVYSYPQLDLWKPLGTDLQTKNVYNRFAHVFFSVENIPSSKVSAQAYLDPPALDAFRVHVDPCGNYAKQENVKYILSSNDKSSIKCLKQIKTINYPAISFRVYEVQ